MFFNKFIFFSSDEYGVSVLDPVTKKIIYHDKENKIEKYQKDFNIFYNLNENNVIKLIKFN